MFLRLRSNKCLGSLVACTGDVWRHGLPSGGHLGFENDHNQVSQMFVDHLNRADLSREQLQRVFDEQIEKMFRLIDDQLRKLETSHPRENIVGSKR